MSNPPATGPTEVAAAAAVARRRVRRGVVPTAGHEDERGDDRHDRPAASIARPRRADSRRQVPPRCSAAAAPRSHGRVESPRLLTVFVTSGAVLVLETLAGRLLALHRRDAADLHRHQVVLAGIAAGTFVGGRLADRYDHAGCCPHRGGRRGGVGGHGGRHPPVRPSRGRRWRGVDRAARHRVVLLLPSVLERVAADREDHPRRRRAHRARGRSAVRDGDGRGNARGRLVTGFVFVAVLPTTPVIVAGIGSSCSVHRPAVAAR
ncbi:MAG: hypothetical protein R2713_16450 [Ilumatobacteraceae bacterium]